jgi:hypothetical protein
MCCKNNKFSRLRNASVARNTKVVLCAEQHIKFNHSCFLIQTYPLCTCTANTFTKASIRSQDIAVAIKCTENWVIMTNLRSVTLRPLDGRQMTSSFRLKTFNNTDISEVHWSSCCSYKTIYVCEQQPTRTYWKTHIRSYTLRWDDTLAYILCNF